EKAKKVIENATRLTSFREKVRELQRWENTAQWCRNTLVQEGLLSSDSPRGIWEITAEGEKLLREKNRLEKARRV
ncbi:MAG: winged helix-turn-helix domain-containing protein, partial [Thermodesulfovibrionales bacterium]